MKKLTSIFVILCLLCIVVTPRTVLAADHITLSPSNSSLNEGQSSVISISLSQPIVATPPGNYVSIQITSSNPDSVTITPSTVLFSDGDWASPKNFTVTVPNNETYGDTRNILIIAKATSGSNYYNNFTVGATIRATDMSIPEGVYEPAPETETVPETQSVSTEGQKASKNTVTPTTKKVNEDTTEYDGKIQPNISGDAENPGTFKIRFPEVAYEFLPNNPSTWQQVGGYVVMLILFTASAIGPIAYFRRKAWWRRQRAKHVRWYFRHRKS